MLDNRIYTFIELCNTMNYHKTAENLNMTQPAVTQHIKFLEDYYSCKLFDYSSRKLLKTKSCGELEKYARALISLNLSIKAELFQQNKVQINVGATKTIGEYMLKTALFSLMSKAEYEINLIIDNTENLLNKLNHFDLDILLLEGYFDKDKYQCQKISDQKLVGICSVDHPFAFKQVSLTDVFEQKTVFREKGSGTRNVFEMFLLNQGYSIDSFKNKSFISSNKIIETVVQDGVAISFAYEIIPNQNDNLASFTIKDCDISHQFNYVFLNSKNAQKIINIINSKP